MGGVAAGILARSVVTGRSKLNRRRRRCNPWGRRYPSKEHAMAPTSDFSAWTYLVTSVTALALLSFIARTLS